MTLSPTSAMSSAAVPPNQLGLPDIALVGRAGAGKTTVADFLADFLGYEVHSFATPIKRIIREIWGIDAVNDRSKAQDLGRALRQIDPDALTNMLLEDIGSYSSLSGRRPRIVDDTRYPNEWYALEGAGFVVVRVNASLVDRIDRLKANGKMQLLDQLDDESETAVDDMRASYTIWNTDSRGALEAEVLTMIAKERRKR